MCRASYRRKNVVDTARAWSQYLRRNLAVANQQPRGRAKSKTPLGRKFRRKAQWQRRRRRKRRSTKWKRGLASHPAMLKFSKGLHSLGASKRTVSVGALVVSVVSIRRADLTRKVPPSLPRADLLSRSLRSWCFWVRSAMLVAAFPANIYAIQKRLAIAGRPVEALLHRTSLQIVILAATRDEKTASQNPTQFY